MKSILATLALVCLSNTAYADQFCGKITKLEPTGPTNGGLFMVTLQTGKTFYYQSGQPQRAMDDSLLVAALTSNMTLCFFSADSTLASASK